MRFPTIRKHDVVFFVLAAVLVSLGVRLGRMIHNHTAAATVQDAEIAQRVAQARQGQKLILPLPARPGNLWLRSRHSYVLAAGSRQAPSCFVDPKLLSNQQLGELSSRLAKIFNTDPGEIYRHLLLRRNQRFVWIQREISNAQADAVRALKHRGVGIEYEWWREYPNGALAGTVIGFTNKNRESGGGLHTMVQHILQPTDGKRVIVGDARRRPIRPDLDASVRAVDGGDVYLSLDAVVQEYLQQAVGESVQRYGAKWGTGVVVNPWTGDVLAMCSVPTFDPNRYNETPPDQMLNRAICCPYEPGSVFKPIIAASAVQAGVLSYESQIFCENGRYRAHRGGVITDHGHYYGYLSLRDVNVKSSNIGMAKVGEKLGNAEMYRIVRRWGFGSKTSLGLPGETGGIVRRSDKWDGYSLRRVPFGQEISTSSLQLVMAFSAFANGGWLMKPRLVQNITDARGQTIFISQPTAVRRVLSESVANQTLSVLQEVIERGTGKKCRLEKWTSWGKTGTAQIPGPHGYTEDGFVGSFIGGAPANRPAVVCLISIYWPDRNKGYYGGTVAAPYVKEVLQKTLTYLQVTPDRPYGQFAATAR